MRSLIYIIVAIFTFLTCVNGQTGNYILESYNAAVELKLLYEVEVDRHRGFLTLEAWDMGRVFGNYMADWIALAENENQGEALRRCAEIAADGSQANIDLFADRLVDLQRDSDDLHLSVFRQLMDWNIKSEEYSLFYYYHSQRMDEGLERLNDYHVPRLQEAYNLVFADWFVLYAALQSCGTDALQRT